MVSFLLNYGVLKMPSFEFGGRRYETDSDGHLLSPTEWTVELGRYLFDQEGIQPIDDHWEVIRFLREYHEEYKIAPMLRILIKAMQRRMGENKGYTKYLYDLFPGGRAQACKIAGLEKPSTCC